MKPSYQIVDVKDSRGYAKYLAQNGQLLLALVELLEASRLAVDELIDILGRASIEAVLQLSAAGVAGEKHQGRKGGGIRWHGAQSGQVSLSDRKLRVTKPRLRRQGRGPGREVEIPAYEAMNNGLGSRLLAILMHNVSTRNYKRVIPEMAESVGISKSSVSRQFIEASAQELERLAARRFDELELLIIYLDGLVFGEHLVIGAVGVDAQGHKHVLGVAQGAARMPRPPPHYWKTWWHEGLTLNAASCLSSTAPRRCGRPSTGCLAPATRCSAAATIRSRMSATSCRMNWRRR